MGNKFNNRTQVNLRPKVCKSPPPPKHPEDPPPIVPLCVNSSGQFFVGVSPAILFGVETKVYFFVPTATRTYIFGADRVGGGPGSLLGKVYADSVLCCATATPILCSFTVPLDGISVVLTSGIIYIVCLNNAIGGRTYTISIT